MLTLVDLALGLAALPVLAASLYLAALALASARTAPPAAPPPRLRFDLVIPAHDEEGGIGATVESLLATDWPEALRRVVVVADNCQDQTAARAREAGATVLERQDADRRGKGFALAHAFDWSLADGFADAVVVVDADSTVTPNLLRAYAARLEAGAAAVQSDNAVGNPEAGWRPALMALAFVLFNTLRSLGRERLGLSVGLRGNGMCLSARLLREVPHQAFSEVEDLEYGLRVGEAGHRVWYAWEGRVLSEMVTSAAAAGSQRRRWEGGRRGLGRRLGWPLLRRGLAARDPLKVDLGLDLLVPPLALLGASAVAGTALVGLVSLAAGRPLAARWAWGAALAGLLAYLVRGFWLSGLGWRGIAALLHVPVYFVWKLRLALGRSEHPRGAWVRTQRENANRGK